MKTCKSFYSIFSIYRFISLIFAITRYYILMNFNIFYDHDYSNKRNGNCKMMLSATKHSLAKTGKKYLRKYLVVVFTRVGLLKAT